MNGPTCGECGKGMNPENSRIAPELFMCDECVVKADPSLARVAEPARTFKCLFCDYFATADDLREHSATCRNHPAVVENERLENENDRLRAVACAAVMIRQDFRDFQKKIADANRDGANIIVDEKSSVPIGFGDIVRLYEATSALIEADNAALSPEKAST